MINTLLHTAQANPLLAGLLGSTALGGALVYARAIPARIAGLIKEQFTCTLDLNESDLALEHFELWLSEHDYAKKARRLGMPSLDYVTRRKRPAPADDVSSWMVNKQQAAFTEGFELTPGVGTHWIWEGFKPLIYERRMDTSNGKRMKSVVLTTFGRSQDQLRNLMRRTSERFGDDSTPVNLWNGNHYGNVGRKAIRSLSTIFMDETVKTKIVDDAKRFLTSHQWYTDRGIPYRRGYLLEGPPGTGKSSFTLALAGELDMPVYIINLATLRDDNALQAAMNNASDGVVVMEDIDAAKISRARPALQKSMEQLDYPGESPESASGEGITLSGLLNAIDGIGASDGRILIMTSNDPSALDPALLRPGRVDVRAHFDLLGIDDAARMYEAWYPEEDRGVFMEAIVPHVPISPAVLQGHLLSGPDIPALIHLVKEVA